MAKQKLFDDSISDFLQNNSSKIQFENKVAEA